MPTSQQHTRVNLEELKAQIIQKIGAKRTDKYFGHLCDLFSQKLTKVEFEKLCCLTIGKENIGLNNQLILSIVKNAYLSVVPERLRVPSKSIKRVWGKPNSSLISNAGFLPSSSRVNGDPSARSPCKTGSRIRDRKVHDRRLTTTTFPPHVNSHRADSSAPQGVRVDLSEPYLKRASLVKARTLPSVTKALENGDLEIHDLSRPLQLGPASSTAELPEAEALPQSKRPRLEILASPEQVSGDKVGIGVVDVGNDELVKEVELVNGDPNARSPCKTGSRICHRKVHDRRLTTTIFSPHVNSHRADSSAKKGVRVDISEPYLKRVGLVKAKTLPSVTKALENGDLKNQDLSRPLQLGPASSTAELPEAEALPQSKRPRLEILALPKQVSGDEVGIGVVDVVNEELVKEVNLVNGDPSARSPCKTVSRIRDRKVHDRRLTTTTFPPHVNSHWADSSAPQGARVDLSKPYLKRAGLVKARTSPSVTKAFENGDLENHDLWRPLQLGPASSTAELPEAEALPQSKRPRLEILASSEQFSGDEVRIGVVDVGNEELVKEVDISIDKRLSAPLGIPFRSGSLGFARRSPCSLLSDGQLAKEQGCLDNSELPSTKSLRRWMEQLAESIGLQGVSEDSANVLNHGLDALLKRLIKSCFYLKGRSGQENEMLYRQSPCTLSQEIVSVKHSNPQRMSNACIATDTAHMESCRQPFSFIDFKTAMELNPEQLGGLRPLWMEKICVQIL